MTTESTLASDAACSLPLGLSDTELLALITRDVGATVGVFNLQLRLIYCNDEYARWFGTEPSQVIGKTVGELYGEADGLRILEKIKKLDRSVHVIMLSSQTQYGVALQTVAKGAEQYVLKGKDQFDQIDRIVQGMLG